MYEVDDLVPKTDIWDLLKRARVRRGMTQEELADCLGVDQTSVSMMERKVLKNFPDPDRLIKLSSCLGITRTALFRHLGYLEESLPVAQDNSGLFFQMDSLVDELRDVPQPLVTLLHQTIAAAQQISEQLDKSTMPSSK